jgi:hypothetical protein
MKKLTKTFSKMKVDKNLEVQDDGCNKGDKGAYPY